MVLTVTRNKKDGTYDIHAYGEREFTGVTFASVMSDYIADCAQYQDHHRGRDLRQASLRYPFAVYEQAMIALWPTVPKFGLSVRWERAVMALGVVINFFRSGDMTLYETSLEDCGLIKAGEEIPRPYELLEQYEVLVASAMDPEDFDAPEDWEEVDEDNEPVYLYNQGLSPDDEYVFFNSDVDELTEEDDDYTVTKASSRGAARELIQRR